MYDVIAVVGSRTAIRAAKEEAYILDLPTSNLDIFATGQGIFYIHPTERTDKKLMFIEWLKEHEGEYEWAAMRFGGDHPKGAVVTDHAWHQPRTTAGSYCPKVVFRIK